MENNNVEVIDDMLDGVEKMIGQNVEKPIEPKVEKKETPIVNNSNDSDLNSIFESLSNDVAGANKFMSTLAEKQKNANITEAYLTEQK